MMVNVYLLLGGLTRFGDGYLTSAGMYGLAKQLRALPGVSVDIWPWAQWISAGDKIQRVRPQRLAIIGYSGGGSRATYLANYLRPLTVDLLVLYDPSPAWQMQPVGSNVRQAICYENDWPLMFGLGGGKLIARTNSKTYHVAEQHLLVQFDQTLHIRTVAAVRRLCPTP